MIITALSGGIGNQLFQYSAALAKSNLKPEKVILDLGFYELSQRIPITPRNFGLKLLGFSKVKTITLLQSRLIRKAAKFQSKLPLPGIMKLRYEEIIERNPFHFDERVLLQGAPLSYLNGYWQWKEHAQISAKILKDSFFVPTTECGKNQSIFHGTNPSNRVALHVRRGDYTQDLLVCGSSYFSRAAYMLQNALNRCLTWYIFSDDISWTKSNIRPPGPSVYVGLDSSRSDIEDFQAMASCKYQIISNSSFSWWAAFVSSTVHHESIILAPDLWWNSIPTGDISIYPKEWKTVSTRPS